MSGYALPNIWENQEARRVLDSMTELFFVVDRNYDILFVNRAVLQRNERHPDEYAGKNHWDLWPTMQGSIVEDSYVKAFATGVPVRFEYFYDPTGAWIDANVYPYGDQLHIYFRDITERKLAEQELAKQERNLRDLLDAIPHVAWAIDDRGDLDYINRRWAELTGIEQTTRETFRRALHPDDLPNVLRVMERALETGLPEGYDTRVRTKNGDYRWVRVRWSPLKNERGEVTRYIGTSTDVHDEILAETALRESEEKYRLLAEQLEDIVRERTSELEQAYKEQESFSYSVSHDLRTPLRSIVSNARILNEDFGDNLSEDAKHLLQRQSNAALKLAQLIDDLLELSRIGRQDLKKTRIDLTSTFQAAAHVFDVPSSVRFEIQEGLDAMGDQRLLQLVAQNLIENALKFSPNGGRIKVGRREDGAYFVSDQGIGFRPEYASKLFQPFHRLHTEEEFPGTGIGLASVKRIIERHNGRVWAEGAPDEGATFFFTLGQ